jgi:hypothetical protein
MGIPRPIGGLRVFRLTSTNMPLLFVIMKYKTYQYLDKYKIILPIFSRMLFDISECSVPNNYNITAIANAMKGR